MFLEGYTMDNISDYKEVFYNEWCKKCINYDLDESEEPCNECLTENVNLNSHKPVMFVKKPVQEKRYGNEK